METNSSAASAYQTAGLNSFKEYGVHHLSKSSCSTLLQCSHAFNMRSDYKIASIKMSSGQLFHGLNEEAVKLVKETVVSYLRKKRMTFEEFTLQYKERLQEVPLNIASILEKIVEDEIAECYSKEVLYDESTPSLAAYKDELITIAQEITKKVTRSVLIGLIDPSCPVIDAEEAVTFIPPVTVKANTAIVPYLGYIDQIRISAEGKIIIRDLKTSLRNSSYTWNTWETVFQLWLYKQALLQNNPELVADNIVCQIQKLNFTMPKWIKRGKKDIWVDSSLVSEIKTPILSPGANSYFMSVLQTAQDIISGERPPITAQANFGCKGCSYVAVCPNKFEFDWQETTPPMGLEELEIVGAESPDENEEE